MGMFRRKGLLADYNHLPASAARLENQSWRFTFAQREQQRETERVRCMNSSTAKKRSGLRYGRSGVSIAYAGRLVSTKVGGVIFCTSRRTGKRTRFPLAAAIQSSSRSPAECAT